MRELRIDNYTPQEVAERIEGVGVTKATLDFLSTLILGILAGAFIALGANFYTLIAHDTALSIGISKLLGGLAFSLGLILVVVAGAELFTGNNLIVMAFVSRKITMAKLLRNWAIVYVGNLLGALSVVFWIYITRQWTMSGGLLGAKAIEIANAKVNLSPLVAFSRGVLCNALVCLALWLAASGRSVTDKILAIVFPITAFVALGFEHSVANMYFIPMGILLKANASIVSAIPDLAGGTAGLSMLNLGGFLKNLVPVTIGNIVGGSVLVGAIYWFVYLRNTDWDR